MKTAEIIKQVALASGKAKEDILRSHIDNEELKSVLKYAYDPFNKYYITCDNAEGFGKNTVSSGFGLLERLKAREVTGNEAKKELRSAIFGMTDEDADLFGKIVNGDLECGIAASTINNVWDKLIYDFQLMQCHPFNEKRGQKFQWPAIQQVKYDAARVCVIVKDNEVQYLSRNGKPYNLNRPDIDAEFIAASAVELPTGISCVFDGELYFSDEPNSKPYIRQISNGLAYKAIKGTLTPEENSKARMRVWDIIPYEDFLRGFFQVGNMSRFRIIQSVFNTSDSRQSSVKAAESKFVDNLEEALAWNKELIERGEEGSIIKEMKAHWEAKRVSSCLKLKKFYEADLLIVGAELGTKRNSSRLGALVCESSCGKLQTNVGTGFSDVQRDKFWEMYNNGQLVGKIATIQYMEVTNSKGSSSYSVALPSFIELRFDKTEADSFEQIKEASE